MPVAHHPSRARDLLALVEGGMQLERAGVRQPAVCKELDIAEATYRRIKALLVAAERGDLLALRLIERVQSGELAYTRAYVMFKEGEEPTEHPTVAQMLKEDPPRWSIHTMDNLRRLAWDAEHGDEQAQEAVEKIEREGAGITTLYDKVYANGRKPDTPRRPPRSSDAITSAHGRKVAERRRDRVNDGVATLSGTATGLVETDLTEVMKITDPAVVQAWADTARRTARALQKFAAQLPTNNHKGDA